MKVYSDIAEMLLNKGLAVIFTLLYFSAVSFAACPQSLYTDSQGTIQSPCFNTTGRYDANMSCTYNIRVSPGRRITLEFKNLSILGSMPNCMEDSVEIFVGCSNTSIGKFCSCSNVSMPMIYSYDNCMTLVFKSDGSNEGKGFEAQYTTANNTARLDPKNCSTDSVTSSYGTIYTPNWPLMYPASASCVWTFNPPPTTIVRFFFTGFDLDKDPICDPNRPPQTGDQISISGTNTTGGQVIVEKRLCTMPDDVFFPIKDMTVVKVLFGSNSVRTNDGTGVMAGYATYIKGYVDSSASRCALMAPTTTVPSSTVSTAVVSTAEVSTPKVSSSTASTAEVSTAKVSPSKASTAEVSTAKVSPSTASTAVGSTAGISTAKVSSSTGPTATGSTTAGISPTSSKFSGGEIAGITIGALAGAGLIFAVCWYCYSHRKSKKGSITECTEGNVSGFELSPPE